MKGLQKLSSRRGLQGPLNKLIAVALAALLCMPASLACAEQADTSSAAGGKTAASAATGAAAASSAAGFDDEDPNAGEALDGEAASKDAAANGEEVIEDDATPLASGAAASGQGTSSSSSSAPGNGQAGNSMAGATLLATLKDEDDEASADDSDDGDGTSAGGINAAAVQSDSDTYGDDADTVTVHVRTCIEGKWLYASRDGTLHASADEDGYTPAVVTKQAYRAGGNREIVPASVLEEMLASVGFSSSEIARADLDYSNGSADWGGYLFAYAPAGTATIHADVTPQLVDGAWYVFTMGAEWISASDGSKSLDLYYLPTNRNDGSISTPASFFADGSKAASDSQLAADNGFHAVTVEDPDGLVYGEDEIPETAYVNAVAGPARSTITLRGPPTDSRWSVSGAKAATTDNGDGTVSIALSSITGPVTIKAEARDTSKVTLTYSAALADSDRAQVGGIPASDQIIGDNLTIDGSAEKTVTIDATSISEIELASPDADSVTLTWARSSKGKTIYTFAGWDIGGTVYAAGDTVSIAALQAAADFDGAVTAKSTWTTTDAGTAPHINTANFYVNLNCEILDIDGTTQSQSADLYTPSIHASRVWGTDTFGADSTFTLLAPASSACAAEVDSKIRASVYDSHGIFPPSSWTNYTDPLGVRLESLPSDEEVLASVRASSSTIKIDGEAVDKTQLTSTNFTVRWASMKYDSTDGWHIDGVLVAKKAKLTVTKTFEGETDALAAFSASHGYGTLADYDEAKGFHIDVTHEEASSTAAAADETETTSGTSDATGDMAATKTVTDYSLLLVADSALDHSDATDRRYGYTSYDAATNTYTWEIETRQNREYTVREKNHYMPADDWNNLTWYQVKNSANGSDTQGWTEYDAATAVSVKVTALAYPADTPQSSVQAVSFRNAYVHKGTLVVHKNDYATGQPMAGVAFAVAQTDAGAGNALYRKRGTNEYTTDPTVYAAATSDYEKVDGNRAVTDEQGVFYLSLAAPEESSNVTATYELSEDKDTAPGYEGPDTVTFSMTYKEGIAEGKVETTGGTSGVEWANVGENRFSLLIKNRSTEYTSVTAKAQWAEGSTARPVTVQLWRSYGTVDEPVAASAGGSGSLEDIDGNAVGNTAELSEANSWAASWAALPLFIDNQQVTYHVRETWIGTAGAAGSVAYDGAADGDGYADYAVSEEAARYAQGDMPDTAKEGDELRALFPLTSPVQKNADGTTAYAQHALLVVDNAEVSGEIAFTKVDAGTGAPLSGAVFALYSDEACTDELERVETGSDGLVAFDARSAGTYYIREVAAPAGYSVDKSTTYQAKVASGTPVVTKVGDIEGTHISKISNELGASLIVTKIGINELKRLAGAMFTLTKEGGTGSWADAHEAETAADGTLTFTGISTGKYTLKETRAPKGYAEPDGIEIAFDVTVDADTGRATFELADEDAIDGETFLDWKDESTDGNVVFALTVRNDPDGTLPEAGSCALGALAAAAATSGAAGLHARRRKDAKR